MWKNKSAFVTVLMSALILGCSSIKTRFDQVGIDDRRPYEGWEQSNDHLRLEIKRLENRLAGRNEILQYGRARPYFLHDRERVEFLRLPNYREREKWLREHRFWSRVKEVDRKYSSVVEERDLAIGMTAEQVRKSLGEPEQIHVSGHPAFGNMIWVYRLQEPSHHGFLDSKKTVIFERGVVVGWDSQ